MMRHCRPVCSRQAHRFRLVVCALTLAGLLVACSSVPGIRSDTSAGGALNAQAGGLILVVLDNSRDAARPEAGSTPHGYDRNGAYAAGDWARSIASQLADTYHLTPVREWPIEPLQVDCLVFALPPRADRTVLLQRLSQDRRVRSAQPLQEFATLAEQGATDRSMPPAGDGGTSSPYNDPYYGLQWGLSAMNASGAQHWSSGQGVNVAVIDTGADVRHPDLAGRISVARNFIDHDAQAFQNDRHGTLVAGLIGAVANNRIGIVGVAPLARLQIFKACEPLSAGSLAAQCNSFTLALALSAAIEAHAQIVNLSLAGPADPLLAQLIGRGERDGMLFIGAVPPDGALTGFPLGVRGVVAVQESDRSARTSEVLPAPGREVLSLTPAGHYNFASGASMAAAQISGALAMLRAAAPHASSEQLLDALRRSVRRNQTRGDLVNLCVALTLVQPRDACNSADRLAGQTGLYNR